MSELIGKRFRSKIQDMEEDEEFGEVTHPVGSTFVVTRASHQQTCHEDHGGKGHVCGQMYMVAWEQAIDSSGASVPAHGMWTIWSNDEIARDAEEVTDGK